MTRQELLQTAKALPKAEQIDLALELWELIHVDGDDVPVTESQKRELDRRVVADTADPQPAEEWPVLRKRLLDGEL
jgi:putative addiction module component (TIGR02574 family)